ncbi:Shedu anti-phage system protein SduA domain-containing protein [Blastopirellula marina]|uniref:Shedu protein SduA C-terminal domain-containing protein n=1 Tax=Blastopirellula marina TaxID=124 RepID=A0A2S8GME4_9BACT|nr:Shedu anti-phage system protein SduA domain-containing protein [Blastopirellula marina]PQO45592.1 hypothetical protein C5Y93_14220 [Blastopirellula marina]
MTDVDRSKKEANPIVSAQKPSVIFLGFCEKAHSTMGPFDLATKTSISGLSLMIYSPSFPTTLSGTRWVIAMEMFDVAVRDMHLRIVDDSGIEAGWIECKTGTTTRSDSQLMNRASATSIKDSWTTFILHVSDANFALNKPGRYQVYIDTGESRMLAGSFLAVFVEPPPLTQERITAIRTDPNAHRVIMAHLQCQGCGDELRAYTGIERSSDLESKGTIWVPDLPDSFVCKCSRMKIDLSYMKKGLHAFLDGRISSPDKAVSQNLYEDGALHDVARRFSGMVESGLEEEKYQKFIQDNPVLLCGFSPERLYFKSKILSKFVTDFTVLTPSRELILIEIEKPSTRILKKDGGRAADLQHAFDQVNDWIFIIDQHRAAVLECLNLSVNEVSKVSGVVIAGRDSGQDAKSLQRLKSEDHGRVRFLTFDDLLGNLNATISAFRSL